MKQRVLSDETLDHLTRFARSIDARTRDFEELFEMLEVQSPRHAKRLAVAATRHLPQTEESPAEAPLRSLAQRIVTQDASVEDLTALVAQLEAMDPNLPKSLAIAVDRRYPKPEGQAAGGPMLMAEKVALEAQREA